ncbi:amine oxidase [Apiospora aurea]|uniref:Amine oxidase n=1 Tax=Apiospora aurea TaxID=335848 RepID=A0ABR1QE39_9PEZI
MSAKRDSPAPKRIAIVGGGISGMACSWNLRDQDGDVDFYESGSRLGGHANSVPFKGNGRSVDVDTGFVVMDEATYPQFTSFLRELNIEPIPTDLSFGVSAANGSFEWGSYSIPSFVGKLSNYFSPWFWRLAFDLCIRPRCWSLRAENFHIRLASDRIFNHARAMATSQLWTRECIGDFLTRQGYSAHFIKYFLLPMVAAPWCIHPDEFGSQFPAKQLVQFMQDHGLLGTVTNTLKWRSFRNGSKTYVDAFQQSLPRRQEGGVVLQFEDHAPRVYDHVVLAVHAAQALALLGDNATALEYTMLNSFHTTENICYLHSDTSVNPHPSSHQRPSANYAQFLPKRRSVRTAWNCMLDEDYVTTGVCLGEKPNQEVGSGSRISISFDTNKLQDTPFPGEHGSPGRVLVTTNPPKTPQSVQWSQVYDHPTFNTESMHMARHLAKINGVEGVSFAGAWMGFGFHEDGFAAGAHAADMIIHGRENTPRLDLITGNRKYQRGRLTWAEIFLRVVVIVVQYAMDTVSFFSA